jgi:hypothetical protein
MNLLGTILVPTMVLKKVCKKFNGTLIVPLSIIDLTGGIPQAFTLIKCS